MPANLVMLVGSEAWRVIFCTVDSSLGKCGVKLSSGYWSWSCAQCGDHVHGSTAVDYANLKSFQVVRS